MDKGELREANLRLLRRALKQGAATKPQLSRTTGLSVVTVNTLLGELISRGEARSEREPVSCGGRPALVYELNGEAAVALAASFWEKNGRRLLHLSLVNLLGEERPLLSSYHGEVTAKSLSDILSVYLKAKPSISHVFLGLPASERQGIIQVSDFPALRGVPLRQLLNESLKVPVSIINDSNILVSGRAAVLGKRAREETIVSVYWPALSPPGVGVFINGSLYTGRDGMAGELGYHYFGPRLQSEDLAHEEAAARLLETIIRTWNPHRLALYDVRLKDLTGLKKRLLAHLPDWLLPELELRDCADEDYRRGMTSFAARVLWEKIER